MTMKVERVSSGAPWENKVGYRRAVKAGPHIWVAGTVSVGPDGSVHAPGDPGAQAARCLEIILAALGELGADARHVMRTRMFVTDISPATMDAVGAAHRAVFGDHPPAATMVAISGLADPALMVEIEVDAFLHDEGEAR